MVNIRLLLEKRLHPLLEMLARPGSLLLDEGQRQALLEKALSIAKRLEELGSSSLVMGLVGGTGVGKSTLMNALAGFEIAHTSHRRPDTDAILVYRHASSDFQPSAAEGIRFREIIHRADAVKDIVLCDLPDFDSIVEGHREQVAAFLIRLDMVIWVASPEKYADAKFYDLLKRTVKSRDNFIFVLNKTDLLFEGVPWDEGYQRLKDLVDVFRDHLASAGIERPEILSVSAKGSESPDASWNSIKALREIVFRRRDEKQVLAIKAANLEAELDGIVSIITDKVRFLERLSGHLQSLGKEVAKGKAFWMEAGEAALDEWIKESLSEKALRSINRELPLVGWPGRIFVLLGSFKEGMSPGKIDAVPSLRLVLPREISGRLRNSTEYIENRLTNAMKRLQGVPRGFEEDLKSSLDLDGLMAELETRIAKSAADRLSIRQGPGRFIFKSFQRATYGLLFLLFISAIASTSSWDAFIEQPDLAGFLKAVFFSLRNLFSGPGISAFLSYLLIGLFLGFRFHIKARAILEAEASSFIRSLRKELLGVWEEGFSEIEGRMKGIVGRIDKERLSAAEILKTERS
jgi:GTP-binding protein EngB required for normal cell division